jgi:hypothetical protein
MLMIMILCLVDTFAVCGRLGQCVNDCHSFVGVAKAVKVAECMLASGVCSRNATVVILRNRVIDKKGY